MGGTGGRHQHHALLVLLQAAAQEAARAAEDSIQARINTCLEVAVPGGGGGGIERDTCFVCAARA